jgi:ABC-type phosphate transport system substrate-binding protein
MRLRKLSSTKGKAARAGLLVGAVVAALGVGGVSAGTAAAAPGCGGSNAITGEGASLQGVAQIEVWSPKFKSTVCPGFTVTYESKGSGPGLAAWDFNGPDAVPFDKTRAFTASDDGPRIDQVENAEKASGSPVVVIPVLQTAITVAVNPPAGCEVNEITNKQLEEIWRGTLKRWGQLGTRYAIGAGCSGANITRVVREEGSGTSYQFKNYLSLINTSSLACTEGSKTWQELEPIGVDGKTPNTLWPENGKGGCVAGTVSTVLPVAKGSGIVKKVNVTQGSIGYAALPDVEGNREAAAPNNNPENDTHWVKLQNNGNVQGSPNFAEPTEGTLANCLEAQYLVPNNAQVGQSGLHADWSKVFGANISIGNSAYPLCTISYDMALTKYGTAGFAKATEETVKDYLAEYLVAAAGQNDLEESEKFYAPLPSSAKAKRDVLGAARLAASKIGF